MYLLDILHFLYGKIADKGHLGHTSLVSWAVVEPAVQVLSVSLPTMGPFMHARTVTTNLRSLRSVLFPGINGPPQDSEHANQETEKLNQESPESHNFS